MSKRNCNCHELVIEAEPPRKYDKHIPPPPGHSCRYIRERNELVEKADRIVKTHLAFHGIKEHLTEDPVTLNPDYGVKYTRLLSDTVDWLWWDHAARQELSSIKAEMVKRVRRNWLFQCNPSEAAKSLGVTIEFLTERSR